MVNNYFKQNKQTDNCNFIGDGDAPKTVYKVHVRGNKETIVRLMNDIINVPDRDQISVADDESRIIWELDVYNSSNKSLPHIEVPAASNQNNIHFDKYREVEGLCLFSFYVGEAPRDQWGLLIEPYPETEWIIDEYREEWSLDESSVEYNFTHSYIYHNNDGYPLKSTYSSAHIDFLMQKYPVHYGCVRLEQLRRDRERLSARLTNFEEKTAENKLQKMSLEFQRTMLAMRLMTERDLFRTNYEIDFSKYLWGELNEALYGYRDHDLSLRFRGIDRFAPICNPNIAFSDEEYDIDDLPFKD